MQIHLHKGAEEHYLKQDVIGAVYVTQCSWSWLVACHPWVTHRK